MRIFNYYTKFLCIQIETFVIEYAMFLIRSITIMCYIPYADKDIPMNNYINYKCRL